MTFTKGVDWSSFQSVAPDTTGLSFAFIKVTEGTSYVNSKWVQQRDHAKANGLVVGFYHYPHIANSAAAEADYFLRQINLAPGDILCLDWEWYGQSVTNQQARDYKDAWLARVKAAAPGHKVIVYADVSSWKNVDTNSNCGDGLWIADYTTAGQPRITHPWVFHQYSDSPVDEDVANFPSAAALRTWAGSQPAPTPTPTPTPPEDDMPQQITGTVAAGDSPIVVLPPCGTAWVAYPNRRLHLGYDAIGTPGATAQVRVWTHDGTKWSPVSGADQVTGVLAVPAAGGRVDVTLTNTVQKISLQTTTPGVGYAVESW